MSYRYASTRYLRARRRGNGEKLAAALAVTVAALAARHAGHAAAAPAAQLGTAPANVALGKSLATSAGWGSDPEWTCLDDLWTRESGWRMVWNYSGSGAYGIPQALPAAKMAAAGPDYMTDPATQIRWGLGYIKSVYGTPCGAWSHEQSIGWY